MPENAWYGDDSYVELEPIAPLSVDLEAEDEFNHWFYQGMGGRRRKAAVALTLVWSGTIALHLVSWGSWFVFCLTTLIGIQVFRIFLARAVPTPGPVTETDPEKLPYISLLVAAKNEEAVITSLIKTLCSLDYPTSRYELWVVNDNSSDRTPILLDYLAGEYEQLRILHRTAGASGGKSGALNEVLMQAKGDIIGVFDADAQVPHDLLRRVLPLFERANVGAVQVRKAIAQAELKGNMLSSNFWIQGQMMEFALDSFLQQQRIALGGLGELRGNGQFVRRTALERCGGWNEETITDDLDLTFRLHLDHWDIDFLIFPPVVEEGVTQTVGLWHQRNRWAEGGYQRYLDYWRLLGHKRLGFRKTFDLFVFWLIQYIMPTATVPDVMMAIARNTSPMLAPVTSLTVTLSLLGMLLGLRRLRAYQKPDSLKPTPSSHYTLPLISLLQALRGTLYMFHWLPVIVSTTIRLSIRPKQLKWVKTVHHGSAYASPDK